jgi:hypothetical protein
VGPNIWQKTVNLTTCLLLSGRRGLQHRKDENPGAFQQDLGGRTHRCRGLVPAGFQVKDRLPVHQGRFSERGFAVILSIGTDETEVSGPLPYLSICLLYIMCTGMVMAYMRKSLTVFTAFTAGEGGHCPTDAEALYQQGFM